MRTRPILFSYDKRFRQTGITTPRRRAIYRKLQDALNNNGLHPEQVVLLGDTRKYVPDSQTILRTFLERMSFLP